MPYKYKYKASEVSKKTIIEQKEKQKIQKQNYYKQNKDKIKLRTKIYRIRNREKYKEYLKNFELKRTQQRTKTGLKIRTLLKKYKKPLKTSYVDNKDMWFKNLKEQSNWRKNNRNGSNWHIAENLRSRIRSALLKSIGNTSYKYKKSSELLGCTISELKKHLETKFKKDMSWSNYGQWHIDHIEPCVKFNLKCPVQQIACFHYSNLQPLWAKENLSKGGK